MMSRDKLPPGRVLFHFETELEDNITGYDDIAVEYAVMELPQGSAGLIIYGRHKGGQWSANWGGRHVVKRLLELLGKVHEYNSEECWFDSSGFCQEHGCDSPCPYEQIADAFDGKVQED